MLTYVINSVIQLQSIKSEWNDLYNRSNSGNIFVSYDWVDTWWDNFGNDSKLNIIVIKHNDKPVCIAPFMIISGNKHCISYNSLALIGQSKSLLCPDHLDVLVDYDYTDAVNKVLYSALIDQFNNVDIVNFNSLANDSFLLKCITSNINTSSLKYIIKDETISPFIKLPVTKYSNWKYKYNKLKKKYNVELKCYSDFNSIDKCIELTKSLAIQSSIRNNRSTSWDNATYHKFHHDISTKFSNNSNVLFAVLECDSIATSILYGYLDKSKYLMYSAGSDISYRNDSVGQVLTGLFCDHLYKNELAIEYDFLRGAEEYKFRWTSESKTDYSLKLYNSSLKSIYLFNMEHIYANYLKLGRLVKKHLKLQYKKLFNNQNS